MITSCMRMQNVFSEATHEESEAENRGHAFCISLLLHSFFKNVKRQGTVSERPLLHIPNRPNPYYKAFPKGFGTSAVSGRAFRPSSPRLGVLKIHRLSVRAYSSQPTHPRMEGVSDQKRYLSNCRRRQGLSSTGSF